MWCWLQTVSMIWYSIHYLPFGNWMIDQHKKCKCYFVYLFNYTSVVHLAIYLITSKNAPWKCGIYNMWIVKCFSTQSCCAILLNKQHGFNTNKLNVTLLENVTVCVPLSPFNYDFKYNHVEQIKNQSYFISKMISGIKMSPRALGTFAIHNYVQIMLYVMISVLCRTVTHNKKYKYIYNRYQFMIQGNVYKWKIWQKIKNINREYLSCM